MESGLAGSGREWFGEDFFIMKEIEKLKKEIIERVEKIAKLSVSSIDVAETKKNNYVGEARTKLSFLDLVLRGRSKPVVADYQEDF